MLANMNQGAQKSMPPHAAPCEESAEEGDEVDPVKMLACLTDSRFQKPDRIASQREAMEWDVSTLPTVNTGALAGRNLHHDIDQTNRVSTAVRAIDTDADQ